MDYMMDANLIDYAIMAEEDDYDPTKPEYIRATSKEQMEQTESELLGRQIEKLEMFVERRIGATRRPSKELQHYDQVCAELRQARPRRRSSWTVDDSLHTDSDRHSDRHSDIGSPSLVRQAWDTGDLQGEDTEVPDSPKKVQRIRKSVLLPTHAVDDSSSEDDDCFTGRFRRKRIVREDTTPSTQYQPSLSESSFLLDDVVSTEDDPSLVASSIGQNDECSTADDNSESRTGRSVRSTVVSIDLFSEPKEPWTPQVSCGAFTPRDEPATPLGRAEAWSYESAQPISTPTGSFAAGRFVETYESLQPISQKQGSKKSGDRALEGSTEQSAEMTQELEHMSPRWVSGKEMASDVRAYPSGSEAFEKDYSALEESMELDIEHSMQLDREQSAVIGQSTEVLQEFEPIFPEWGSNKDIESAVRAYLSGKKIHNQSKESAHDVRVPLTARVPVHLEALPRSGHALPKPVPSTLAFKSERVGKSSGASDAQLLKDPTWFGGVLSARFSIFAVPGIA
jgi:hypothetical protein